MSKIVETILEITWYNVYPSFLRSIQEGATRVSVSANRDASARSLLPEGTRLLSFSKQPAEQARKSKREEGGRGVGAQV